MAMRPAQVVIDHVKKLNLYKTSDDDTIEERRNQIISTRIFIILFLISLTGLIGYASLSLQTTTVRVQFPTQTIFEELYSLYPETLVCPCTRTSIQMDAYTHIEVTYHQICSSMFVDGDWISSISPLIPQIYYLLDTRRMLASELQLLAAHCQSAATIMSDALINLASSQFFAPAMLSRDDLNSQTDIIVDGAKKNAIAEQKLCVTLAQSVNQQNQLVSALSSNYIYSYRSDDNQVYSFIRFIKDTTYPPTIDYTHYIDFEICSCMDASGCTYPSGIYPNLTGQQSYLYTGVMFPPTLSTTQISNIQVGCMPFDSITKSTLECFYQFECLSLLFNTSDIKPLDINVKSNYPITTIIDTLFEQLFIENISSIKNFESFFQQCQPTKCSYLYNSRGNIAFIITIILSLISGLFTGFKFVAPFILEFYQIIRKKIKKCFSSKSSVSPLNSLNQNQENSVESKTKIPTKEEIFNNIRTFVINYNLFKSPYNDEHGQKNEILSTRIYIVLLTISVIVIIFYGLIIEHTLTYHIESPSLNEYRRLYAEYSTLTCECEKITSDYSSFITFNPRRHQLCTSIFVSETVIPRYYREQNEFPIGKFDILIAESSFYSTGRSTCSLGGEILSLTIEAFVQTVYVSSYLTPEKEFFTRMTATVNNFIALAPSTFSHILKLLGNTIQGNQLLTGTFSNAQLRYNSSSIDEEHTIEILWIYANNESCNCGISTDSCAMTYDDLCNHTYHNDDSIQTCLSPLPGLTLSCYIIDGLLQSSQECFYDINCITPTIKLLLKFYNISDIFANFLFIALDKNKPSRFAINATGEEIIDLFAVEDWNQNIDYNSYYQNCHPINCLYTVTKKSHIPTIITTVIGLIGGVSVILKIFVPLFVRLIRRRQIQQIDNTQIHPQVNFPSTDEFEQLHLKDLHEFSCPCLKTSIPFETFASFNFTFHQICSSDFISEQWLKGLFNMGKKQEVSRAVLGSHFEFLRLFCSLSNETVVSERGNFYTNQLISVNALQKNQFADEMKALIIEFQTKTLSTFRHNLALITNITLGSQIMSVYETNWHFIPDPQGSNAIYTKARSYQSGTCSCGSSKASFCVDPLVIGNNVTVSGMMIGCLPITSLRLSTLECFYNQTCLNQMKTILNIENITISALDSTQTSQFFPNTTLNHIIDHLMLEKWTNQTNFTKYFDQCNPQECTYSLIEQNSALSIFATLLGLYGGLTVALKVLAPIIVSIIRKILNYCQSKRTTIPEAF